MNIDVLISIAAWVAGLDAQGWTSIFKIFLYIFAGLAILLPSIGEWYDTKDLKNKTDNKRRSQALKAYGRVSGMFALVGLTIGKIYLHI
ncbi:hypothetical protein [Sphingomonas sp. CFBP 13706]|uniref:hypothetical protein n=1 Tax=Sphingomonas sp. CFBP 13706 TaxID=2775314 RepID=UPI00177FE8C4|nr:hypothetical protein [Sphingomonas sp. CFBP 13706]MBD8737052.1 hypothetical protein [Sphingomonas sp. CFBP 13706]